MITDYKKVFDTIVEQTAKYITDNNLKAMVLGISGGIDSTVVAAICYEVSILTGVPLIGRSLPTKFNKEGETTAADLVGKAFCHDYKEVPIENLYMNMVDYINDVEADYSQTKLANGNIQARIRMLYLYNLAGVHRGIVMDTDNLTENNLGYFTIHGDVGDFNPIGGLWKTEVFELAKFLVEKYSVNSHYFETYDIQKQPNSDCARCSAIAASLKLVPTAGLGITSSDLEELGAESYEQVDAILQGILRFKEKGANKNTILETFYDHSDINSDIINNVVTRHFNSEFKRKQLPIKINREIIV